MRIEIRPAGAEDREALIALLWDNGMEHAEPISDYFLALAGNEVIGCIRMESFETLSLIRPVVVSARHRNKGIGRKLVSHILSAQKPIAVAARGEAVAFYRTIGFDIITWEILPQHQREECRECTDRETCRPQPMGYGFHNREG